MKLVSSLSLLLLVAGSVGPQTWLLLRDKRIKMAVAQIAVSVLAIAGVYVAVYRPPLPSIARLLVYISPW